MKYYGQAEATAKRIVDQFSKGNLPKAIAPIFLQMGGRHADGYSWANQLLVALAGYSDSMGYNQWQKVGRQVRAGEHALWIFAPVKAKRTEKDPDTGETKSHLITIGFRLTKVFGLEQTDIFDPDAWEAARPDNSTIRQFLDELPLRNVAEAWGLSLQAYNGKGSNALGWYRHGSAIALGVSNLSTWAHELCHAADDRNGKLKGDKKNTEIVAELGGAILLTVCGYEREADIGGAWSYITAWAGTGDPTAACMGVLTRACEAVALILETAGLREPPQTVQAATEETETATA